METIAVIFGGRSTEHDVSVITAIASIIKPLELNKGFRVEPVYIAKNGAWYWDRQLKDIALFSQGKIEGFIATHKPVDLEFNGGLRLVQKNRIGSRSVKVDIVFPAMHGTYGEDGDLSGLLDMAGVPYVGCGVSASAIAMDKVLAKQLAIASGLPTPDYLAFTKEELEADPLKAAQAITRKLTYPVFVKPAHLGSSIGISRVIDDKTLKNALEVASHYDNLVLAEKAVENLIEVTLPIMGNDKPQPALLERPLAKAEDFFDFETKYLRGGKKNKASGDSKGSQGYSEIPAKLTQELYDQAVNLGLNIYRVMGCSGIARVDMLINEKTREVYFNEVNPLPGGLYAHNWNKCGISNVELVNRLVELAKARFDARQQLTTVFDTNYLKQF